MRDMRRSRLSTPHPTRSTTPPSGLRLVHARGIVPCMQYTIRNIPLRLDQALKARAKKLGKSVNQIALEALAQSVEQPVQRRNLHDMPGAWSKDEAARFDRFLDEHREIDPDLWK